MPAPVEEKASKPSDAKKSATGAKSASTSSGPPSRSKSPAGKVKSKTPKPVNREEHFTDPLDVSGMTTEEAASAIWDRCKIFAEYKNGLRCLDLFREIDKDRSGKIDAEEFKNFLYLINVDGATKKVAKAIITRTDENGDGQLEYSEFLHQIGHKPGKKTEKKPIPPPPEKSESLQPPPEKSESPQPLPPEKSDSLPVERPPMTKGGSFRGDALRVSWENLAQSAGTFHKQLAAADPVTSYFWWWFKHPATRMATCIFVLFTNFYVYLGDPASYSQSKSYGTLVGDIYHGFLQPDEPWWLAARYFVMLGLAALGTWLGILLQQKVLRDYCHLALFGYDNGRSQYRDPLADQDGAAITVGLCVCGCWFVGLKLYAGILTVCGAANQHIPDSGMHNWTFAGYNLALAGVLTFVGDWFTMGAIFDQMLQTVHAKEGGGYLAYAAQKPKVLPLPGSAGKSGDSSCFEALGCGTCCTSTEESQSRFEWWAAWWAPRRLWVTRAYLLLGWPPVLYFYFTYFGYILDTLNPEPAENREAGVGVGKQLLWSADANDEFLRMLAAALVAFGNLCIVAQDWEFPDFSESPNVSIMAVSFSSFTVTLPPRLRAFLDSYVFCCSEWKVPVGLYISGKWFSYFGIVFGLAFDWAYWFMTALCFRTCDYAQFWESSTGRIFAMTDFALQQHHAGGASAQDCPWFTDNPLIENWYRRNSTDDVYVVLVETGTFTGAYTINEENVYVFSGKGAEYMWLMCIPPLVGWFGLAWIICTHERVTCFNYKKLLVWAEAHRNDAEERQAAEEEEGFGGFGDNGGGNNDGNEDDRLTGDDDDDDDDKKPGKRRSTIGSTSGASEIEGSFATDLPGNRINMRNRRRGQRPRTESIERHLERARSFQVKQKAPLPPQPPSRSESRVSPAVSTSSRKGYEQVATEEEP